MDYTNLITKIFNRTEKNIYKFAGKIPEAYQNQIGNYALGNGGGWTDGFWIGVVALGYAQTGRKVFLETLEHYQDFYAKRAENDSEYNEKKSWLDLDHDIGFIFSLSQVAHYKLTGDKNARKIALSAADILVARFNEKGHFIQAWNTQPWDNDAIIIEEKRGKAIIDSMMNMPILMWAYEQTNDENFKRVAALHSNTVMKYFVRNDGSLFHTYNFDPETGAPKCGVNGQGYSDDSSWTRGQSWGLYGFSLMYGYTNDEKYLHTAIKIADRFIFRLGDNVLPLWDFDVEDLVFRPYDSSAAAIALSGLIELSKYTDKYSNNIQKMLENILKSASALDYENYDCFLLHGCIGSAYIRDDKYKISIPHIDTPLIYADYFFAEALCKLNDISFKLFW